MSKVMQAIVLVMLALLPAHAQEASPEPAKGAGAVVKGDPSADVQGKAAPDQEKSRLAPKEQMKGLDEQVQEIKTDLLSISTELNQLEEKLLYPSDTQIAVFVSVAKGEKFRLDAVDVELDGRTVAHHLYTFKELEALQKGGVQRIFVGNVRTGEHALHVTSLGKSEGGSDFRKDESFKVTKNVTPKLVGLVLAGNGIGSNPITLKEW